MSNNKGKLIVVDGTDASGKKTQTSKAKDRLIEEGNSVKSLDFPQYENNFFGKFLGQCLRGDHGDWVGLNPKIASVIYAADRFESSEQIRQWLNEGNIVILDRYVSSNQIHQGGKIHDEQKRTEFMQWLDIMEHEALGVPRPDAILYLDVPVEISQRLLKMKETQDSKKYLEGKKDQHENDIEHLTAARESGLKMVHENSNAHLIECTHDNEMLSIEIIHERVYSKIKEILNT